MKKTTQADEAVLWETGDFLIVGILIGFIAVAVLITLCMRNMKPNTRIKIVPDKNITYETVGGLLAQVIAVATMIRQTYDLKVDDSFEVILPNYAKKIIILSEYILVVLDDLIGNICLLKRQEKKWPFVAVLESFPHQGLINRRLNHVYLEGDNIAFVYNNRLREYDLGTGKMIVNQQVRNARSKEYLGKDITKKFIGKVVR